MTCPLLDTFSSLLDFRRLIPSFGRFWLFDDCSSLGLFYKRILTLKVPLCQKIFREFFSACGAYSCPAKRDYMLWEVVGQGL
jgi:hypothetical protein